MYKETTGAFDGVQTHDRHENIITFHNQTVSFTKAQLQNFCIMFYHLVGKIAWTDSEITSTFMFGISSEGMNIV